MKHSTILFITISLFILSSCTAPQELQYKGFDNFTVTGSQADPQIKVDISLYNPNPVRTKLKKMEATISVNENEVGTAGIEKSVKLKSNEVIVLPIIVETSLDQLKALTKPGLESLLYDKPLALQISGNITIRKFIFKKSFDFIYMDEIKVGDLKLN